MAAAQSAEQKAAAEKVAAEKQAAEAKAAEEASAKAAAEKAAADADEEPESEKARYYVAGPVAVIRTQDGSERYMYRNAPVNPDAFDSESIKHLLNLGLIAESK